MVLSDDKEILQAVAFDNVNLSSGLQYFQNIKGLVYRCAQAGNAAARYMLGKVRVSATNQFLYCLPGWNFEMISLWFGVCWNFNILLCE